MSRSKPYDLDKLLHNAIAVQQIIHGALSLRIEEEMPNSEVKILHRIKTRDSIIGKIARKRTEKKNKNYGVGDLTDIVGFRLVCHFQDDIVNTVRMLAGMIKKKIVFSKLNEPARLYTTGAPNQVRLHAKIASIFKQHGLAFAPDQKESQYTSLHLTCELAQPEGFLPVEIQVRNVFEDAWSSIEHASKYKNAAASKSVSQHLKVLAMLAQTCVEYAEAIYLDMHVDAGDDGVDQSFSVEPLLNYSSDLTQFPPDAKRLFTWITTQRKAKKHRQILEKIAEVRLSGDCLMLMNPEVAYLLEMEEALSQLMLNNRSLAQGLYESILRRNERRAMVPFRLSDVHKLNNEHRQALDYVHRAEQLLESDSRSSWKTERDWIRMHLPLKKAYFYWKTGDTPKAYATIHEMYEALPKNTSPERRRNYFSSLVYYALEVAIAAGKVDDPQLQSFMEKMRELKMHSIDTTLPEHVDTYAWLCHHRGENEEARRAILEVLSCIRTKSEESDLPVFEHRGNRWSIALDDLAAIHEHLREILAGGRAGPRK